MGGAMRPNLFAPPQVKLATDDAVWEMKLVSLCAIEQLGFPFALLCKLDKVVHAALCAARHRQINGGPTHRLASQAHDHMHFPACSSLLRHGRTSVMADCTQAFEASLESTANLMRASQGVVWKAMVKRHGRVFALAGLVKLVHDIIMFLGPFVLEQLLKFLENGGSPCE